jgi:hypothetical protein
VQECIGTYIRPGNWILDTHSTIILCLSISIISMIIIISVLGGVICLPSWFFYFHFLLCSFVCFGMVCLLYPVPLHHLSFLFLSIPTDEPESEPKKTVTARADNYSAVLVRVHALFHIFPSEGGYRGVVVIDASCSDCHRYRSMCVWRTTFSDEYYLLAYSGSP